jgi:hypothetical protein
MSVLISKDEVREPLYVVMPVQNPWRWKSRYKHTDRTIDHLISLGAVVILVEVAHNRRELVYADSGLHDSPANIRKFGTDHNFRHQYIGLSTADNINLPSNGELWLKENQVRIGVQRVSEIDRNWQNIAWNDADVHYLRPNIIGATIQALQHFDFVQMFSHARDLDPDYEMLPENFPHADGLGYVRAWQNDELDLIFAQDQEGKGGNDYYPPRVWPGLAWACTRRAWEVTGGLMDFHIWGGGDYIAAHALIGRKEGMIRNDLHPNYKQMVMAWFDLCERYIRRNVGVVMGTVVHHFHGLKEQRGYSKKHSLLARAGFDPIRHLKKNAQGLWQLNDDGSDSFRMIRDAMRLIAKQRDEDSTHTGIDKWGSFGH